MFILILWENELEGLLRFFPDQRETISKDPDTWSCQNHLSEISVDSSSNCEVSKP